MGLMKETTAARRKQQQHTHSYSSLNSHCEISNPHYIHCTLWRPSRNNSISPISLIGLRGKSSSPQIHSPPPPSSVPSFLLSMPRFTSSGTRKGAQSRERFMHNAIGAKLLHTHCYVVQKGGMAPLVEERKEGGGFGLMLLMLCCFWLQSTN